MRPPICVICHNDFRASANEGGLVKFKTTDKEKKYNQRMKNEKITGHPSGLEWFCGEHYALAKTYQHLAKAEAIIVLKS